MTTPPPGLHVHTVGDQVAVDDVPGAVSAIALVIVSSTADPAEDVEPAVARTVVSVGAATTSVAGPAATRLLLRCDLLWLAPGVILETTGVAGELLSLMRAKARPGAYDATTSLPTHLLATDLAASGLAVVAPDPVAEARRVCGELATQPPLAVRTTAEITRRTGASLAQHLRWESDAQMRCLASPEHRAIVDSGVLAPRTRD